MSSVDLSFGDPQKTSLLGTLKRPPKHEDSTRHYVAASINYGAGSHIGAPIATRAPIWISPFWGTVT